MAKVKTLKAGGGDTTITANLTVRRDGLFYVKHADPDIDEELSGETAAVVEKKWQDAARDYLDRRTVVRKVIAVRFDSGARKGGAKCFFSREATMTFDALIVDETTVTSGDNVRKSYAMNTDEWPQKIPSAYRLSVHDIRNYDDAITFIPWTEEAEATIIRACEGLQAVIDMLDGVLESPESFQLAMAGAGIPLLQAPENAELTH